MKKKLFYMFAPVFLLFTIQQLSSFGMIEFVKELRDSADIRTDMRKYYESNENVETIVYMDDEIRDDVYTELLLKNNIRFVFRACYKDNELKTGDINYFGDYSPCKIVYNSEKDECQFWKGWYQPFIGSNSVEYFINNAEECIKKIEALPEYTADKFYCSEGENAKEVFNSLPGEAIQLDEFRWEKYVKVKRLRLQ
ncbi:MAG: hypothetical protein J5631_05520 [Spirochaetaceae bacterium]|nr:hypothetical protein [Spirochaetaceae bacterium]